MKKTVASTLLVLSLLLTACLSSEEDSKKIQVGENKPNTSSGPVRVWAVSPAAENQIETSAVIRVGFTESADCTKVDDTWLQLREVDTQNEVKGKLECHSTYITFTPSDSLASNTRYIASVHTGDDDRVWEFQTRSWTHRVGTTNNDYLSSFVRDAAGNYFIAGTTEGELPESGFKREGTNFSSIYLLKMNSSGGILWARQWINGNVRSQVPLVSTSDGGVVLSWVEKKGSVSYKPPRRDAYDVLVLQSVIAKFDGDGNRLWDQRPNGDMPTRQYHINSLKVDSITGAFYYTGHVFDFEQQADKTYLFGDSKALIVRFADGDVPEEEWYFEYNDASCNDYGKGLAFDTTSNDVLVYIGRSSCTSTPADGINTPVVLRLDRDRKVGNVPRAFGFGGSTSDYWGDIAVSNTGDVILSGHSQNDLAKKYGFNNISGKTSGMYLARLHGDGTPVWVTQLNWNTPNSFSSLPLDVLALAPDQKAIYGSILYTANSTQEPEPGLIPHGGTDFFVFRFNMETGEREWARLLGSYDHDKASILQVDSSGSLYVGATVGHRFLGTYTQGGVDIGIVKMDEQGRVY